MEQRTVSDMGYVVPAGYEYLGPLGSGGMGEVYKASQVRLRRTVAIKTTRPLDASAADVTTKRLLQEAQIIARLRHSNIVQIIDCLEHDGQISLVMEHLDGCTLADILDCDGHKDARSRFSHYLKAPGRLAPYWIARIGSEIARALSYAHSQGIIHRDIKPSNIFITYDGETKLIDFSISRDAEMTRLTVGNAFVGTALYMAPEQFLGKGAIDDRADIYSLGCVLYHCMAGAPPFTGSGLMQIGYKHLNEAPREPGKDSADYPPALTQVIMECLRKDPSDRIQQAAELDRRLMSVFDSVVSPPTRTPATPMKVVAVSSGTSASRQNDPTLLDSPLQPAAMNLLPPEAEATMALPSLSGEMIQARVSRESRIRKGHQSATPAPSSMARKQTPPPPAPQAQSPAEVAKGFLSGQRGVVALVLGLLLLMLLLGALVGLALVLFTPLGDGMRGGGGGATPVAPTLQQLLPYLPL